MIGIVLNSGRGSRLGNITANNTKCMASLTQNDSIISLQIKKIEEYDLRKIIITTGYLSHILEKYVGSLHSKMHIDFVENKDWATTNYIVSLDRLFDCLFNEDVILMHGDLVFSSEVLEQVAEYPGSCVAVDSTLPLPEKDFKARVDREGLVKEIGVHISGEDCVACQPLYKLKLSDWKLWQDAIHEFCKRGETGVYAENALNTITDNVRIHVLDVKGQLCMEIDDQNDLAKARKQLAWEGN